jgi:hypothetical protein
VLQCSTTLLYYEGSSLWIESLRDMICIYA